MDPLLTCIDDRRRMRLQAQGECAVNGLDYVEAAPAWHVPEEIPDVLKTPRLKGIDPRQCAVLYVAFHHAGGLLGLSKDLFRIEGGRRIPGPGLEILEVVTPVEGHPKARGFHLALVLARRGDESGYRLSICSPERHGIDPRFSSAPFRFAFGGEDDETAPCSTPSVPPPQIDYLARDYGRLRRLLLDRLSVTLPEWKERHVPDIGMMLVELFAYLGDHLSYQQDAVATEAYLRTARRRISVRRHARLVDYILHEGCNARTFVHLQSPGDDELDPADVFFVAGLPPGEEDPPAAVSLARLEELGSSVGPLVYFEPVPCADPNWGLEPQDILAPLAFLLALGDRGRVPLGDVGRWLAETAPEAAELLLRIAYSPPPNPAEFLALILRPVNRCLAEIRLAVDDAAADRGALSEMTRRRLANQSPNRCPGLCNRSILEDLFPDLIARRVTRADRLRLFAALNEIPFYTWDGSQCWLPQGATSAVLRDEFIAPAAAPGGTEPPRKLARLAAGQLLLLEEIKGSRTGNPDDAHPGHRQIVRIVRLDRFEDPLVKVSVPGGAEGTEPGQPLVEVHWHREDALRFPLCLSARGRGTTDCRVVENVSVARGNIFLVDHGLTVPREPLDCSPAVAPPDPCGDASCCGECSSDSPSPAAASSRPASSPPGPYRPVLKQTDLTHAQSIPTGAFASGGREGASAMQLLRQQPHKADPQIHVQGLPPSPDAPRPAVSCTAIGDPGRLLAELRGSPLDLCRTLAHILRPQRCQEIGRELPWRGGSRRETAIVDRLLADLDRGLTWRHRNDVVDSDPFARDFALEIDDERRVHLRFLENGPGGPPPGTRFWATYRVGNGAIGNVGAEGITRIGFRRQPLSGRGLVVRNPLPAEGGQEPESVASAKLVAPHINRKLKRAILDEDYVRIVLEEFPSEIQSARATITPGPLAHVVRVSIDPLARVQDVPALIRRVTEKLSLYRRIGHDVVVLPPVEVPIALTLSISTQPGYLWEHVQAELLRVFSDRLQPDGSPGFFHLDERSFGDGLFASEIIAAARKVVGVRGVEIETFCRQGEDAAASQANLASGVLPLGPLEVVVLASKSPKFSHASTRSPASSPNSTPPPS